MKKTILRILALVCTVLIVFPFILSCAGKGKPVLTLEKDGVTSEFSVNLYRLMLSRAKGTLAGYYGNEVNTPEFWQKTDRFDGEHLQTLNEYYRDTVLNNCRSYLAVQYLFDLYGLSLSDADREAVDEMMNELLRTDAEGSENKLNSILAAFGVNCDLLRDAYLLERKMTAVKAHLYGANGELLGDNVKTQFLNDHYVHFRQIFLASYKFVFETDQNGDTIYYYTASDGKKHICYDSETGTKGYDENNKVIRDDAGDIVYFVPGTDYKTIAYDAKNGEPSYVISSTDSAYQTEPMTKEELAALKTRAETLLTDLTGCTQKEFEAAMTMNTEDAGKDTQYNDGYYLKIDLDYSASGADYAYLDQIVSALADLPVGGITMVRSDFGYHIIMKYEHTPGAYAKEENGDWFGDFSANLINSLFSDLCRSLYENVTVDEDQLASVPHMKDIAINYYY